MLALATNFNPNQISTRREISAAVINISGRQRMFSQRTALLSLQLVCSQTPVEREALRQELLTAIELMEKAHNGLLNGDPDLNLPGHPSVEVQAMYFEPPLELDKQIYTYIAEVKALVREEAADLNQDNPHLRHILNAASTQLLAGLDVVVNQYQKENEAEQMAIDQAQAQLYCESCALTACAQAQAQKLEKALHELQQTQAQLVHAERISSLGQLVASLAHEINNPVNFIYGNLTFATTYVRDLLDLLYLYQAQYPQPNAAIATQMSAIDLDYLNQDLPQVLSSMTVGIDRIRQIVRSLRNFSRMDEAEMQLVDLHEGLDSTLLILQHRLKGKGKHPQIQVIKEYGDLPLVECYAGQLNQVFMNIISNGIDALEEAISDGLWVLEDKERQSPAIRIRTEVLHPNSAIVRIADNGLGMTEEVKARLFNAFFTTKPTGKGTGLGLSISYQLVVEKHGGSLRCESTPGQGTEFWIEIPIEQNLCGSKSLVSAVSTQ